MPLDRPSRDTLVARIAADIAGAWPGSAPATPGFDLRAVTETEADLAHAAYGFAQALVDELLPTTASLAGLQRWGRILNLPLKPASRAVGAATGTATAGRVLAAGALLVADNGGVYELSAAAEADPTGDLVVSLRATDAGAAANLPPGAALTLVTPMTGVDDAFVVLAPGVVGADDEDVEAYRARILDLFRNPPQGGALHDYRRWALQVPGVARAWALPADVVGLGNVSVYVATAEDDPTPPAELLDQVTAWLAPRQRADAAVSVMAPAVEEVPVTAFVTGLPVDEQDAAAARAASGAAAVFAEAPAALSPLPALDFAVPNVEERFYKSRLSAAIGDAAGAAINVQIPGADVTPAAATLTVFRLGAFSVVFT